MIKRAFVKVEGTEKLMIDSNSLVSDKMEEIISSVPEEAESLPEGFDEFTEGLMADKVEMLTSDDQGEGEGSAQGPGEEPPGSSEGGGQWGRKEQALTGF